MKKLFFLFVSLATCSPSLWAWSDFEVGDLGYCFEYGNPEVVRMSGPSNQFQGGDIVVPGVVTYEGKDYRVEYIDSYAFEYSSQLTGVTLSDGIKEIGNRAFRYCTSLKSFFVSKDVYQIREDVFKDCVALESLIVDPANTVYDSRQDCNALVHTETNTLLCGCKTSQIPSGITTIAESAFESIPLKFIELGPDVKCIGRMAFHHCDSLYYVAMPEHIESIGECAFMSCARLHKVLLPASLTQVGDCAFSGCWNLTDVICLVPDPAAVQLGYESFDSSDNCTLHVLPGLKQTYADSPFGQIFSHIEEDADVFSSDPAPIFSLNEGDLVNLLNFPTLNFNYSCFPITDLRIDLAYVESIREDGTTQRLFEKEQSQLVDGNAEISFKPLVDDMSSVNDMRLVVSGEATVDGKQRPVAFEIGLKAIFFSLSDESRNTLYVCSNNYLKFSAKNIDEYANAYSYNFQLYTIVDGQKQVIYQPSSQYFAQSDDYTYYTAAIDFYPLRPENGAKIYIEGDIDLQVYDPQIYRFRVATFHCGPDSIYYLPPTVEDLSPVSTASDLKQVKLYMPEGFTYAHADLSASTISCGIQQGYDYVYEHFLVSPTTTIDGSLFTLDFEVKCDTFPNYWVYLFLKGDIEVDGRLLHLPKDSYDRFRHPCFNGVVVHDMAFYSSDGNAEPSYQKIRIADDSDCLTAIIFNSAYEVSLVEAEGRMFTLVNGQEVTLRTLAETVKGTPYPSFTPYPYVAFVWEGNDYVPSAQVYLDMTAKFIVDGKEFVYTSNKSELFCYHYYKPEPSIPETTVVNKASDLKDLTLAMPGFANAEHINRLSNVRFWQTDTDGGSLYSYESRANVADGCVHLNLDTDYLDTSGMDKIASYTVEFSGYGGVDANVWDFSYPYTYTYTYLTPLGVEAIDTITPDAPASSACYDLQGRRLSSSSNAKGLMIKNGRLVLMR